MIFHNPFVLILLVFVPLLLWPGKDRSAALRFPSAELASFAKPTLKLRLRRYLLPGLRLAAVSLFIIALARPQAPPAKQRVIAEGIDIVLALDTSTSMEALDFKIGRERRNRLEVAKEVTKEFIAARLNDRLGLIAFAARPYVVCPLTLDHDWLLSGLERVKIGMIEDGTAIGSSIMAGLSRLKNSPAKTKIIILLTDGRNNAGRIPPLTAAEAARALSVKVYTIGAGSTEPVPFPMRDMFGRIVMQTVEIDLDEESLRQIAELTGGRYFRAADTAELKKTYAEIDKLEKTPFKQPRFAEYKELFGIFLLWGLAALLVEQVLANTLLMKIP